MDEPPRLQMKMDNEFFAAVQDWQAKQRPIPSLSEAIRALVMRGLRSEKDK